MTKFPLWWARYDSNPTLDNFEPVSANSTAAVAAPARASLAAFSHDFFFFFSSLDLIVLSLLLSLFTCSQFAGWNRAAMKQYSNSADRGCGVTTDVNFYATG